MNKLNPAKSIDTKNFPNIQEIWKQIESYQYNGLHSPRDLYNHYPADTWDSMFFTGYYLMARSMQLKRIKDLSILDFLLKSLNTIWNYGVLFRGFVTPGVDWTNMNTPEKLKFKDKDLFEDISRDQITGLLIGLYFCKQAFDSIDSEDKKLIEAQSLLLKISQKMVNKFKVTGFDLGTTYGDCRSYAFPFSLALRHLLGKDSIKIHHSFLNKISFTFLPKLGVYLIPRMNRGYNYFNFNLLLNTFFFIVKFVGEEDISNSKKWSKRYKKSFKKVIKSRLEDKNLHFELIYQFITGESLIERDYLAELNQIFKKTPCPKEQDFIWQRQVSERYHNHTYKQNKHIYCSWLDYVVVYEMIYELGMEQLNVKN